MKANTLWILITLLVPLALFGCAQEQESDVPAVQAEAVLNDVSATLAPVGESGVSGVVQFQKTDDGVRVTADVTGLTPGKHGFHIHEFGNCTAPDASSAGGHYNPTGSRHGAPGDAERHMGDLGNLVADSTGAAYYERVDSMLELSGDHSIVGRAVVVHAGEDDLTSQPTGDAGGRVACGVIGIVDRD